MIFFHFFLGGGGSDREKTRKTLFGLHFFVNFFRLTERKISMPISKVLKSLYQIGFIKIDDVVNTCKYLASWKRSLGKATNRL